MANYSQAKQYIKHYRRFEAQYLAAHELSAVANDGLPRGSSVGDPTCAAAIKAEKYRAKMDIVHAALVNIPEEYKAGVFAHLVDGKPFPDTAEEATWYRWQQIFVNCVAVLLD